MHLRSLKTKFIVYIISLIFCIVLSLLTFYIYQSTQFIREELTNFGFHLARDISYASELAVSSEDPVLLRPPFEGTFKEEGVVLVTVYNEKGNIIASKKKVEIEERIPKDVMEELLKEKKALKRSDYTQKGKEIYSFYSPVLISEILFLGTTEARKIIGFVRVGLSLEKVVTQTRAVLMFGIGIGILVIFLGVGIAFFLVGRMISPIKLLEEGAEKIAKGDFDVKIKVKTKDELELLADSFNKMAAELKVKTETLEEAKATLEIKVEARTKELRELVESREEEIERRTKQLQERIKELEKFHKLTVGRELKMIELKKEIKKLKEESGKYKAKYGE